MGIKQWPKNERPREKLITQGIESLTDAELLAIFFGTGIKGMTAVDLARTLLKDFGSLKALVSASPFEIKKQHGVGEAKYTRLKALLEAGKRLNQENLSKKDIVQHINDAKRYVSLELKLLHQEVFGCLFLDTRNQLICFEKLFYGTLNSAAVYPRSVAKRALYHNAASIILAHNHPSGNPEPSEADKALTSQLVEALGLLEIRVLDHLVVGGNQVFSFAEENLM